MGRVRYSMKAVEDLSSIWLYTVETWSEAQADCYSMLISSCQQIATNPLLLGRSYEQFFPILEDI